MKPGAQVLRALLPPLFDAEIILVEGSTFVVAGIELEAAVDTAAGQNRVSEYGQVWRCTVV